MAQVINLEDYTDDWVNKLSTEEQLKGAKVQTMTEEEALGELEKTLEKLLETPKLDKKELVKELVKYFISGFVGGCSGTLVYTWMGPFGIEFANAPKIVSTVVEKVGKYGLQLIVISKVVEETKRELDAIDTLIEYRKMKSAAKKALLATKKAKKEKYTEVKEG